MRMESRPYNGAIDNEHGAAKMKSIIAKIETLSVETIKDMIVKLIDDARDEAGIVLDAALDALREKVGDEEFQDFCNAI